MGSDSMMNKGSVPVCPKEFGKKKRTNRLAKLKQEKLDARREQWLSQAKNKGFKEELSGGIDSVLPVSLPPPKNERDSRNLEMKSTKGENVVEFIMNCGGRVGSVLGGNDTRKERPGSSSGSCSSSSGCFSGTISEEEEEEERVEDDDDGCLDDWETMADALIADEKEKAPKSDSLAAKKVSAELAKPERNRAVLNPEAKPRAWRPDDAYRPQSLPNLAKQLSLPTNSDRHCRRGGVNWACRVITSPPSSCPICYEDLDLTDSSFLPCSCGFHLCLFCHKRILEADARCPGCRKQYADPLNKDTGVGGGAAPSIRFTRSCSMNTRS
ncbi:hypothetical protein MKW98_005896 [Papaver atlanticum]|uniref:RING-type domain-containing protein n=1 Tax=Papaver atlanticum TaxID=357466 RepID=A0AAD4TE46_9MAGN|nr:hypothetical protein MKW98_005896 [Papaver atlanticum]